MCELSVIFTLIRKSVTLLWWLLLVVVVVFPWSDIHNIDVSTCFWPCDSKTQSMLVSESQSDNEDF